MNCFGTVLILTINLLRLVSSQNNTIERYVLNRFDNHIRTIAHVMKESSESSDYLMFVIDMRNKIDITGLVGLCCYGFKGRCNDISTSILDVVYSIDNKTVKFDEKLRWEEN